MFPPFFSALHRHRPARIRAAAGRSDCSSDHDGARRSFGTHPRRTRYHARPYLPRIPITIATDPIKIVSGPKKYRVSIMARSGPNNFTQILAFPWLNPQAATRSLIVRRHPTSSKAAPIQIATTCFSSNV